MDLATTHLDRAATLDTQPARANAHRVAALAYCFVNGEPDRLPAIIAALGTDAQRPQLTTLLEEPEFVDLREFLDQRGVEVAQLQRLLDSMLAQGGPPQPRSPVEQMLAPLVRAAASGQDVDALLDQLRESLRAQHPDRTPEQLDAFIDEFRTKLAAFQPGSDST